MITFTNAAPLPTVLGFACKQLTQPDAVAIMRLQDAMLAALPNATWYYPSPVALFDACCARGESFGFFDGPQLVAFGTLTPWYIRPDACYAGKVGEPTQNTFDFQDVMVHPVYRRLGLHSALLTLFDRLTRAANGNAIYCTIAPENLPSVRSFKKAGYVCIRQQPAYEGMLRGYYRKVLP